VAVTLRRMETSDTRKLKALEEENRRLKKFLAETMLDASTRKVVESVLTVCDLKRHNCRQ
jgi:hypothetical protein